jgi:hypothetical protein
MLNKLFSDERLKKKDDGQQRSVGLGRKPSHKPTESTVGMEYFLDDSREFIAGCHHFCIVEVVVAQNINVKKSSYSDLRTKFSSLSAWSMIMTLSNQFSIHF